MRQTITIDTLPPGLNGSNGLMRMHWAKLTQLKAKWAWLIKAQKPKKHKRPVVVTYTRISTHPMDLDNVAGSFKLIGDSLVGAGVLPDDSPDVITQLNVSWEKAATKKEQGVRIVIADQ